MGKMKIFKHKKLIIYFLIIFAPVIWWKVNYPSGSWRYKITVEVETPEGIKSGSAVRELFFGTRPHIFPEDSGFSFWTYGEAVAVDLGKRGVLFALVQAFEDRGVHYALKNPFYSLGYVKEYGSYIRYNNFLSNGRVGVLPEEEWPLMVMFKDINDPKTMAMAYGKSFDTKTQRFSIINNNMENLFGHGVQIKRIVYEMTDEPASWSVHKKLPWLKLDKQSLIEFRNGNVFTNEQKDFLQGWNFF